MYDNRIKGTTNQEVVNIGNLGVACTRLNVIGRRPWAAPKKSPASYKDEGGETRRLRGIQAR
jgi:hypothetical protein